VVCCPLRPLSSCLLIDVHHRYNPELLDPWENHVAVVTRGWRDVLSPNHTYELGHSTTYVCGAPQRFRTPTRPLLLLLLLLHCLAPPRTFAVGFASTGSLSLLPGPLLFIDRRVLTALPCTCVCACVWSRSAVPDLTDGVITVRVTYSPKFDHDRCVSGLRARLFD
jgi:hypothetical protein